MGQREGFKRLDGPRPSGVPAACNRCNRMFAVSYRRGRDAESDASKGIRCPACGFTDTTLRWGERRCSTPGCDQQLSRGNPGPTCFTCDAGRAAA